MIAVSDFKISRERSSLFVTLWSCIREKKIRGDGSPLGFVGCFCLLEYSLPSLIRNLTPWLHFVASISAFIACESHQDDLLEERDHLYLRAAAFDSR